MNRVLCRDGGAQLSVKGQVCQSQQWQVHSPHRGTHCGWTLAFWCYGCYGRVGAPLQQGKEGKEVRTLEWAARLEEGET